MRKLTHNVFSIGLALWVVANSGIELPLVFALALWLSLSANYLIDAIGHTRRGGRPVRTWVTHSLLTAPLWGAGLGAITVIVTDSVFGPANGTPWLLYSVLLGVLAGYSHLLLDSLTEGGIFLAAGRVAIAHWRNNGILTNFVFVLFGILLTSGALAKALGSPT